MEKNFIQTRCQERAKTRKLFNLKSNWACPHYMHLLLLLINLPKWQVYVLNGGSHNTLQNIFSFYLISPVLVCKDSPCHQPTLRPAGPAHLFRLNISPYSVAAIPCYYVCCGMLWYYGAMHLGQVQHDWQKSNLA